MTIKTTTEKNSLATKYGQDAAEAAIYTTVPGATAGTEPTGGTPAYARKALAWSAPVEGVITAEVVFDVPAGTTIVGGGVHAVGGDYLDGSAVTSQAFATQGTYTLALSYTQT